MRFTVQAVIMCTIGVLLSIVLGVQPVLAACADDSDCPSNQMCYRTALGSTCISARCGPGHDCPTERDCIEGLCKARPSGGSGGGGAGIPQSGLGQACGQVKIGQVTKNVPCKTGLQCVKVPASSSTGTCQKPLQ